MTTLLLLVDQECQEFPLFLFFMAPEQINPKIKLKIDPFKTFIGKFYIYKMVTGSVASITPQLVIGPNTLHLRKKSPTFNFERPNLALRPKLRPPL